MAAASAPKTFAALGLAKWLQEACDAVGFRTPTTIQAMCIPPILQGTAPTRDNVRTCGGR